MMADFAKAGARAGWGGQLLLGVILADDGLWHGLGGGKGRMGMLCALWLGGGGEGGAASRRHKGSSVSVGDQCDEQDKDMPRATATATATAKMQNSD